MPMFRAPFVIHNTASGNIWRRECLWSSVLRNDAMSPEDVLGWILELEAWSEE